MRRIRAAAIAMLFAVSACSEGTTATDSEVITLTAAQAAALVGRMESFAPTDPSLAALADTVDVVIKAGAEARRIDLTTDLGASQFYAVSLHMPNTVSSPASATFHVIAFDDPDNPSRFIILGGWAQGSGTNPPTSVDGQIGGHATTSLTGHLFSVSGNQISAWHAVEGSSTLTATATQQPCTDFAGPGTCVRSTMDATFSIVGSVTEPLTTTSRSASGAVTGIPGIRLSF